MTDSENTWDFFIAHAGADTDAAEALYEALADGARVFLDTRCIDPGDDWDLELARAQKDARVCVVLVSERTGAAYYQREEIAAAIDLARSRRKAHRVVPIYLGDAAKRSEGVPYGLRLKHVLTFTQSEGWAPIAARLLDVLHKRPRRVFPSIRRDAPAGGGAGERLPAFSRAAASVAVVLSGVAVALAIAVFNGWIPSFTLRQPPPELPPGAASGPAAAPMGSPLDRLPPTAGGTPAGATTVARRPAHCVSVDHLSPNLIPHYLLKSVGNRNFPYLLKVTAENGCGEPRDVYVRFETGENVQMAEQTKRFPLPDDGKPRTRIFDPQFTLASRTTESITIHWSIEDEKSTKLQVGSIETEIVPPYTIAWDLKRPARQGKNGEPVDPEYLLASLAAWTLSPPRPVRERARACRTPPGGGRKLTQRDAIAACYEHLFRGDEGVYVVESAIRFPDGQRQRIEPHFRVLEEDFATALEAALLFAAVMDVEHVEAVDATLTLIVSPLEGQSDPGRKTAFIAWQGDGGAWEAVDMMRVNALGFDDNVADASARVAPILQYNTEIRSAIAGNGAGWSSDRTIAAVHFRNLDPDYRIKRLP